MGRKNKFFTAYSSYDYSEGVQKKVPTLINAKGDGSKHCQCSCVSYNVKTFIRKLEMKLMAIQWSLTYLNNQTLKGF